MGWRLRFWRLLSRRGHGGHVWCAHNPWVIHVRLLLRVLLRVRVWLPILRLTVLWLLSILSRGRGGVQARGGLLPILPRGITILALLVIRCGTASRTRLWIALSVSGGGITVALISVNVKGGYCSNLV
jgi:hypothetical protein